MPLHNSKLHAQYSSHDAHRHSETLKSILAAVMVADNRIHKNELEELVSAIDALESCNGTLKDSKPCRHWLQQNISEINSMVHGPNRDRWLALQFLKLRDFKDKDSALDYLWRVAVADGDLHINEAAIIDKALWLWKNRQPSIS